MDRSHCGRFHRPCVTMLLLAVCAPGLAQQVAQPNSPEPPQNAKSETIFVLRPVPTNFYDKSIPEKAVDAVVSNSLSRAVDVRSGDTISSVLRRELNVSQTWTPKVYEKTVAQVLRLNGLERPDLLRPGKVRIPDLPRTAKSDQNSDNPFYTLPQVSTASAPSGARGQGAGLRWDHQMRALVGSPILDNVGRLATRTELQLRSIPISEALEKALLSDQDPEPGRYHALNEGIMVDLGQADAGTVGIVKVFSDDAEKRFRDRMSQPVKLRPVLAILDDSWPDDTEFAKSVKFIVNASRLIRRHFVLEANPQDSDDIKVSLDGASKTDHPVGSYPVLKVHSAMIKASIKEFTDADLQHAVDVVYLPLTKAQLHAPAALREILYVAALARSAGDGLRRKLANPNESARRADAKRFAETIVNGASISVVLPDASKKGAYQISTDKAVVEAVAFFLSLYSEATQRPHFLSMSWKVADLKFQAYFREYSYGLMVAAAGNDKGKLVTGAESRVQFAARSVRPGDFLAVTNGSDTSMYCDSNVLPVFEGSTQVFGLSFDGRVAPGVCGTSFSAPRVAWLLAAREAFQGSVPGNLDLMDLWTVGVKDFLVSLQRTSLKNQARYAIGAERLLGI